MATASTPHSVPPAYDSCFVAKQARMTWHELGAELSIDLLTASQKEANFVRMIDRKAPVLYEEEVVRNAIIRYEQFWLPLQAKQPNTNLVPPLDVHWIWHTHMLNPVQYRLDCETVCGTVIDHQLLNSEEIQRCYDTSVNTWKQFCAEEPYDFLESLQKHNCQTYSQISHYDICAAMQRQRNFNYQVSLPHYTAAGFLTDAISRYQRFLLLKQTYPSEFITPCYDFDLVWHAHQVHPIAYNKDCLQLLGRMLKHDDTVSDRSADGKLLQGEVLTKSMWKQHFPEDCFWRRGSMYRGHSAPFFLGFDTQDLSNITYGDVHIPSIALKEIPVQREHLRLNLSYGCKKVTTFNADLSGKDVMKPSFSLVWQPIGTSGSDSIVKFPFERCNPKDLLIELELFDKVFLQKKELVKFVGRTPLEELLPPSNSKQAQNVAHIKLRTKDGDVEPKAKVNVSTTLALNRELQLTMGAFVQQQLVEGGRLWNLCSAGALNRCAVQTDISILVGTHCLADSRDGTKYTVLVIHSAPMLLSMVLVYGKDNRLLSMAHLIGSDSLPSEKQLDPNLQFLPHLSSSDERAMVITNKDGDFAIVKAQWTGFARKIVDGKGSRTKMGNAGKLQVEAYNLLKNTVYYNTYITSHFYLW